MQKKDSNSSQQSIERALNLLNYMAESRVAMNITEISQVLNISRSTAYAMINVMVRMNYLSKDPKTGKYFLGYQPFILGSKTRIRYGHLLPCDSYLVSFMPQLSLPYNGLGLLVLEQDYNVIRFITKRPRNDVTNITQFAEQRVIPAYCVAGGKVLLAGLAEDQWDEALSHFELKARTMSTVTEPALLKEQFKEIRRCGYGIDIEEAANFEVNVAAPIRDYSGKWTAAVNIAVSRLLFQNRPQEYIQLMIALGRELSAIMGYHDNL